MAIVIEDIRIYDQFRGSQSADWLLANVGEHVYTEIDFYVETFVIDIAGDTEIVCAPTKSKFTLDTSRLLFSEIPIFQNINVGDQITISSALNSATFIVKIKHDDQNLEVNNVFVSESLATGDYIYISTPITGIRYYWNFVANSDPTDFNSIIDGELQRLVIGNADATDTITNKNMIFNGAKSYQFGYGQVLGRGVTTTKQKFRLIHQTILTPLFLTEQYNDLLSRVSPDYFTSGECLKYVFKIEANDTLANPNNIQSVLVDTKIGNTGWFNENYNTGLTKYSILSHTIQRISDSATIGAIQLDAVCESTIIIQNTADAPFSNSNTKVNCGFFYLPDAEELYQKNGNDFKSNFLFDRALNTVGSAFIVGDNNATDNQIITRFSATFISSSQIQVKIRWDIAAAAQAKIGARDLKRYAFWVGTENHALTKKTSDKVHLLVDVNDFFLDLKDIDLVDNETRFIQHPYTTFADGVTTPQLFPVDDVVAYSRYNIDFTGKENDGILIRGISNQIVLTHATESDIVLESLFTDTSASPLIGGLVQNIDTTLSRIFKIPDGEIRKDYVNKRDFSLDSGQIKYWFSQFPFMMRWEYWVNLLQGSAPTGIFDNTKPNNGLNNFWHRFTTIAGWTINHRLKFNIQQNGELFEQVFDNPMLSYDFEGNAEWTNNYIKSFDPDTLAEITNGGVRYFDGSKDTLIEAKFTKTTGTVPPIGDVEITLWIETFEQGGVSDIRRFSSVYPDTSLTWFKSINNDGLVDVTYTAPNIFKGKALIDITKLPKNKKFTIYARLYDKTIVILNAKVFQDGNEISYQDGNEYIFQDQ